MEAIAHLPEEAPDHVLEETDCLLLYELIDHIAQHSANSVEALVCLANIGQSDIIKEDLLHNEDRHGLAELGTSLHDTKTKGDDFGCQQEIDNL